jgi:hypothetical protein
MTARFRSFLIDWLVFVAVLIGAAAAFFWPQPPPAEPDSLNVPLGVEQAAIVTYSGPPIAVAPYKWGVAVNVRIAGVTAQPGARIYDVRYIVNRGGAFDLKDYLAAADGEPLEGLPSFKFHGDPKLSQDLDARIRETEPIGIDVGGHYYATLAGLGAFWLVWLLLLIFYRRPPRPVPPPPAPPEPTLAELLRAALAQLESGALDAAGQAKLEMLLLRRWREELALDGLSMSAALQAIDRSEKTGQPLRQLQHWLHQRASTVARAEIAAALAPFAAEPPAAPAAPAPTPPARP